MTRGVDNFDRVWDGLEVLVSVSIVVAVLAILYLIYYFAIEPHLMLVGKVVGGIVGIIALAWVIGYIRNDARDDIRGWME